MPGITPTHSAPTAAPCRTLAPSRSTCACAWLTPPCACVLLALADPNDPTHAVSARRYNARRSMFDAPGDGTLAQYHGGTWALSARRMDSWRRSRTASPSRPSPPKSTAPQTDPRHLPHCGMESTAAAIGRHASTCLADPANYAALPGAADG